MGRPVSLPFSSAPERRRRPGRACPGGEPIETISVPRQHLLRMTSRIPAVSPAMYRAESGHNVQLCG